MGHVWLFVHREDKTEGLQLGTEGLQSEGSRPKIDIRSRTFAVQSELLVRSLLEHARVFGPSETSRIKQITSNLSNTSNKWFLTHRDF